MLQAFTLSPRLCLATSSVSRMSWAILSTTAKGSSRATAAGSPDSVSSMPLPETVALRSSDDVIVAEGGALDIRAVLLVSEDSSSPPPAGSEDRAAAASAPALALRASSASRLRRSFLFRLFFLSRRSLSFLSSAVSSAPPKSPKLPLIKPISVILQLRAPSLISTIDRVMSSNEQAKMTDTTKGTSSLISSCSCRDLRPSAESSSR
mmetsp:Transcript_12518/g.36954  ORF Transcript_12518/g.36954 Transcript_12518/m.36954 type:complete len:207 (+) Transcript_12518:223-843(+)